MGSNFGIQGSMELKCVVQLQIAFDIQMRLLPELHVVGIFVVLLSRPCEQALLKALSQTCLCDVTDNCDMECCCDSECITTLGTILSGYGRCTDDSFGIPLCSGINITDLHIDDLYSGLRTIYTVVKRLFCIQRVNVIDPTSFYIRSSNDPIISDVIAQGIQTPTLQPSNVSSLSQPNIPGIFTTSEAGICIRTNSLPSSIGTSGLRECRAFLNGTQIANSDTLSVGKMRAVLPNIRIFSMGESTSLNPTPVAAGAVSSCTGTVCSNVVRLVKLFISPGSNTVRQDLSYVIIGSLENVQSPSYIILKYQYVYLNQDGTFANASNIGYKIGSALQLLKRTLNSNQYVKSHNPLNLAYRKPDGTCKTSSSESADESIVQLRLGRNEFHTCIGDLSNIYNNLRNSFDLIGIMGSSNTVLADYISIDWPSLTANPDSSNVVLKIYYVKVGSYFNPQYYVVKALAQIITNTAKEKALFIEYQQVSTAASTYIPPPPKVDAYLPNDFLFPFYVAQ